MDPHTSLSGSYVKPKGKPRGKYANPARLATAINTLAPLLRKLNAEMQRSPPPKSTQAIVEREPVTTGVGDTGPPSRMSQADAIERVEEVEDGAEAGAVGTEESKPLTRLSPLDAQGIRKWHRDYGGYPQEAV